MIDTPVNSQNWQDVVWKKYAKLFSQKDHLHQMKVAYSKADAFSQEIIENYIESYELFKVTKIKLNIWHEVSTILKDSLGCNTCAFGSSFTLLGTQGCDLDLAIYPGEGLRTKRKLDILNQVLSVLSEIGVVDPKSELVKARVPVLKLVHSSTKISLDLVVTENTNAVRSSHLFLHYAKYDWRLRPLLFAVKTWAQSHEINDSLKNTLSSHALTIMTIHYLQV